MNDEPEDEMKGNPPQSPLIRGEGEQAQCTIPPPDNGGMGGLSTPGRIHAPRLWGSPRLLRTLLLLSDRAWHRSGEIRKHAQCRTPPRTLVAELRANGIPVAGGWMPGGLREWGYRIGAAP